ncbi:hypothetical protein [Halosimplex sp. J119]
MTTAVVTPVDDITTKLCPSRAEWRRRASRIETSLSRQTRSMTLERFSEKGHGNNSRLKDPIISLRRSASIGINQSALEKLFADADGAVMYFDEEKEVIGIEPVESKDEEPAAYSLTRKESTASISPGHSSRNTTSSRMSRRDTGPNGMTRRNSSSLRSKTRSERMVRPMKTIRKTEPVRKMGQRSKIRSKIRS